VPVTRNEIETYYRTVIEGVDAPIIISSNTSLMGYTLPADMVESLVADYPQVNGILIADNVGPAFNLVQRYSGSVGDRVKIRIGMTGLIVTAVTLGAHGLLCFEPNIAPKLCASVWDAMQSGESATLLERYRKLMQLNLLCSKYGNPRSLKEAMAIVGRPSGYLRHPYLPLSESDHNDLEAGLAELDLGAIEGY
jgi:4-hydroxy-tetrahydrodipicolinate synthase